MSGKRQKVEVFSGLHTRRGPVPGALGLLDRLSLPEWESARERAKHVVEFPALDSAKPKFMLCALNLGAVAPTYMDRQRGLESLGLLVEKCDLLEKLRSECVGLEAVSLACLPGVSVLSSLAAQRNRPTKFINTPTI